MEEQLIAEIERRSVLYDRSVQACKKMSARDEAWREVADIMKQSEGEVKKRWRTLRDSFMRFHRLQRTFGPKGKKKMWIYYNEMSFLIPHIEPRDYKTSGGFDGCNEYGEDGGDQNSRQEPLLNAAAAAAAADMVSISSDMCEAELTTTPPPLPPHQQHHHHHQYPGGDGVGCPCSFNGAVHPEPMVMVQQQQQQHHREQAECGGKRKRTDDPAADSDEHFALSCVAALRRLPPRKNAETRVRILHVLYEAEYGEEPSSR